jgi:lipoprotein-anchoring transpeptidase ErfK/SrfK
MKFAKHVLLAAAAPLALAACGEPASNSTAPPQAQAQTQAQAQATPGIDVNPAPLAVPPPVQPSSSPLGQAIDKAEWSPKAARGEAARNALIRAEVLLSRAHFSPGVIDGQDGGNLKNAVAAYERANSLPEDGKMDPEVWKRLAADQTPVMTDYVITEDDVKGPFTPPPPKEDYRAMAKLDRLGYATPLEALAEKFRMDEALLKALNPGVDYTQAGTTILVTAPGPDVLPAPVTQVEVDKARNQVRAYGADGRLMAAYPATVGSSDMPTPSGTWAVNQVTFDPHWNYDPSKLNFGDKTLGKLDIKPGPNNPVGAVWIDLTKDTYGIHGAPDPRLVGKTASHGCVRLTNWDARQLASAVGKGTKVVFTGEQAGKAGV